MLSRLEIGIFSSSVWTAETGSNGVSRQHR
jgi:hypothetical protein